jgi:hypothetical protein
MSQRIGMADGRCLTFNQSNKLLTDDLMKSLGLAPENNSRFREMIQDRGPNVIGFQNDMMCLKPWES